jgi:transcriptional regulator with XRE-family HTH domain
MTEPTLMEVLEGYAAATPNGNDQEILHRWMEDHPQFAGDLMDFAAARAYVRTVDDGPLADEDHYDEIGSNVLKEVLIRRDVTVPESLTAAAEGKGWRKPEFAQRLGLSLSLLMYLEKRRLLFSTIPKSLIGRIAELLETSEQVIAAYLAQPPSLAGEASFKTRTRPDEVRQREFADAVREDQTLSASDRQRLLSER